MNKLIEALLTLAIFAVMSQGVESAHRWLRSEVLRKIREGQPSLAEFSHKLTGKESCWLYGCPKKK